MMQNWGLVWPQEEKYTQANIARPVAPFKCCHMVPYTKIFYFIFIFES